MPYTQKLWQDRIKDGQGNIIQEGTPFSAGNMNRIEQGVADAHASLNQAARQTQTLSHGLNVVNGGVDAPVSLQIEGRTLIPMQNTVLDAAKYYVLADKKTKIKWADATIQQGIYKFTGKAEKPTLIRITNFENKVSGSTLESPHSFKYIATANAPSTLVVPTDSKWIETSQSNIDKAKTLDGAIAPVSYVVSGTIAQTLFSFDIIQTIERQLGKIPRVSLADKIQWCKDNISKITGNWHGYGSGPNGNKAFLYAWNGSTWNYGTSHANGAISKLSSSPSIGNLIDSNGFAHFIAYADASDGVTASTINTDYVELEIELKPDATLHAPRVPLYEVTKEHYDLINVTWSEQETLNRYPMVEGVQHLQNPYVMAEGENLLPPFSEWLYVDTGFAILEPYKMQLNTTSVRIANTLIDVFPNTDYYISADSDIEYAIFDEIANTAISNYSKTGRSFNTGNRTKIKVYIKNLVISGTFSISNMMLSIGSTPRPFVPRNPSYLLAETKLGSLNGVSDRLYEKDGKYMARKAIEKDISLDGSINWGFGTNFTGYKSLYSINYQLVNASSTALMTKYNGQVIKKDSVSSSNAMTGPDLFISGTTSTVLTIANTDSGFADSYTPVVDEIKSYFNGWKKTGQVAANPTAAPTLAVSGTSGALDAVTHYVKYTWETVNGETLASPVASIAVAAGQQIDVTIPALPGGVLKANIYIGTTSGSETKQGSTTTTTFTQSVALVAGVSAPGTNTTADRWASIVDASAPATQTAAYCAANKAPNYIPYKLSYQLATSVVSEAKIEGAISVNGLTQVEVGSGVIIREKVVPTTDTLYANIAYDNVAHTTSRLKYRNLDVLGVYKNGAKDNSWIKSINSPYGKTRMYTPLANYDATAEYSVTYIVYDKPLFTNNAVNTTATYANNIRTALDDTVKKVEDVKTETSINTNILYDVLKRLKAGGL